jgi:transcription elongation factor Elf1
MNEKTKKILIRRRIREVITVKQEEPKTFVCEYCGIEQNIKLVDKVNAKQITNGENNNENDNKTR